MPNATMTSKGQLTVPKQIRDELGLVAGSRVSFERLADGRVVIDVVFPSAVMQLCGVAGHRGDPMTLEQMDEAITAGAAGEL